MGKSIADTSEEALAVQNSVLRRLGPQRRSELAAEWSARLRSLALQGIRDRFPGYCERQVSLEYARITLGETLFSEAFGAEQAEAEMSEGEFLPFLIAQLEAASIQYMVTGSVASGYHGQPRATYDIDVVIEASAEQAERLLALLGDRCYASDGAAQEAVRQRTMFQVVDLQSGTKVGLILRKDRPFSLAEFKRRERTVIAGVEATVASAEDCILSKLEWARLGESERQYRDALQVAQVQGLAELDVDYLRSWAAELQVEESLDELLREAGAG